MPEHDILNVYCPVCGAETPLKPPRTAGARCETCGANLRSMEVAAAILHSIGGQHRHLAEKDALKLLKNTPILDLWGMAQRAPAFKQLDYYTHLAITGIEPGMNYAQISALVWRVLLKMPARKYDMIILADLLRVLDDLNDLFVVMDSHLTSGGTIIFSDPLPWPLPLTGEERLDGATANDDKFLDTTFQGLRGMRPKRTIGYSTYEPFIDAGYHFLIHKLGWPIDPLYQSGIVTLTKPW